MLALEGHFDLIHQTFDSPPPISSTVGGAPAWCGAFVLVLRFLVGEMRSILCDITTFEETPQEGYTAAHEDIPRGFVKMPKPPNVLPPLPRQKL